MEKIPKNCVIFDKTHNGFIFKKGILCSNLSAAKRFDIEVAKKISENEKSYTILEIKS